VHVGPHLAGPIRAGLSAQFGKQGKDACHGRAAAVDSAHRRREEVGWQVEEITHEVAHPVWGLVHEGAHRT
jgi:hypothetical protein